MSRSSYILLVIAFMYPLFFCFFFFNVTSTTEIYTLSLHDALPISQDEVLEARHGCSLSVTRRVRVCRSDACALEPSDSRRDRKSTRLNSSHVEISYAVFCLKKKITIIKNVITTMVYRYTTSCIKTI